MDNQGELLLDKGEKVHVATRRGFDGDIRRHFAGTVTRVSATAIRIEGYAFVFDAGTGQFNRRPEVRTRVASLVDANLIVKIIPREVDLSKLRYRLSAERRLVVTDEDSFTMDIDEYNAH